MQLHQAAREGKIETLIKAQRKGMDLNAYDFWGTTPLHEAIKTCQLDCIAWLIANHVNLDLPKRYGTRDRPLHLAVFRGNMNRNDDLQKSFQMIDMLLKAGANPYLVNDMKLSAVAIAKPWVRAFLESWILTHDISVDRNLPEDSFLEKSPSSLFLKM